MRPVPGEGVWYGAIKSANNWAAIAGSIVSVPHQELPGLATPYFAALRLRISRMISKNIPERGKFTRLPR